MPNVTLTRWSEERPPSRDRLTLIFRQAGLTPRWWSNKRGESYAGHAHEYHKVLFCAQGSIRFVTQPRGKAFDLRPGDRLDIPAGVTHTAIVGDDGAVCLEAARYDQPGRKPL